MRIQRKQTWMSTGDASQALEPRVRRVPSVFANTFEDHFPKLTDIESSPVAVREF